MNDSDFMAGILMVFVVLLINVVVWGGLIYFTFWCAQHFGLIG